MDAYSRIIRWITVAQEAPDLDSHASSTTARRIAKTIAEQITFTVEMNVEQTKQVILQ